MMSKIHVPEMPRDLQKISKHELLELKQKTQASLADSKTLMNTFRGQMTKYGRTASTVKQHDYALEQQKRLKNMIPAIDLELARRKREEAIAEQKAAEEALASTVDGEEHAAALEEIETLKREVYRAEVALEFVEVARMAMAEATFGRYYGRAMNEVKVKRERERMMREADAK